MHSVGCVVWNHDIQDDRPIRILTRPFCGQRTTFPALQPFDGFSSESLNSHDCSSKYRSLPCSVSYAVSNAKNKVLNALSLQKPQQNKSMSDEIIAEAIRLMSFTLQNVIKDSFHTAFGSPAPLSPQGPSTGLLRSGSRHRCSCSAS
jgi:hypothetical protein